MAWDETSLASIGASVVFGGVVGGVTGAAVSGGTLTVPGAVVGAVLGLFMKQAVFLLLLLPLFIFGGFTSLFVKLPWWIWLVVVLIFIIIITKRK